MTRLIWTSEKRKFLHGHGPGTKKHKSSHFTNFQGRSIAMEVESASKKSKYHHEEKEHEARMIPDIGGLQWGFPNSIITKIRYCDVQALTSTIGAVTSYIYRANGIFDPDYTGAGHQPMWRDNFAAVYDNYTVLGSTITVEFHSRSATLGGVVGLIGSDTPTLSSTATTLYEANNSVSTIIGSVNSVSKVLHMNYSPLKHMGQEVKDDGTSMTAVGADPSAGEGTYYYGLYASTEDFGSTAIFLAKVEIEYTVKFTLLSKQTQN